MNICLMTFSILRAPYGDILVQDFDDRTPDVFAESEQSEGFIDRARPIDDPFWLSSHQKDWGKWGPYAVPRFYQDGTRVGQDTQAQTVSIWENLESVYNFVYHKTLHRDALKNHKKWFKKQDWPIYVIWWIPKGHQPTWQEACQRLEHLHDYGNTPYAFTFREMFDESGQKFSWKKNG